MENRNLIFKAENRSEAERFEKLTKIMEGFSWYKYNRSENSFYFCINFQPEEKVKKFKQELREQVVDFHGIKGEILIEKPTITVTN
jgi:hypothetical protein